MLILARKKRSQKAHVGVFSAHPLECSDICAADTVARRPQRGINGASHPNHQSERKLVFECGWQHTLTEDPVPDAFIGKPEFSRQRYGHANRLHARNPLVRKAAHSARGLSTPAGLNSVA